jgi:hypothetical protein
MPQAYGLAPWPVEIGAEFVHGANSKFTEVVKGFGLTFTERGWPDYWYFGKERRLTDNDGVDDEVNKVCGQRKRPCTYGTNAMSNYE